MAVLNAYDARKLQESCRVPSTDGEAVVEKALEVISDDIRQIVSSDPDACRVTYLYEDDRVCNTMIYRQDNRGKLVDLVPLRYYGELAKRLYYAGYVVRRVESGSSDGSAPRTGRIMVYWRQPSDPAEWRMGLQFNKETTTWL